jgi:hypothetical protein
MELAEWTFQGLARKVEVWKGPLLGELALERKIQGPKPLFRAKYVF